MNKIIQKATVVAATTLALGFGGVALTEGPASAATSHSHHHVTRAEHNAVRSAKSYLSFMPFSKTGLIEQLRYEKFSKSAATYGATHAGANWNKQATKSAKSYLRYMSFSRDGLIDQLMYDGFTHAQARYGVHKAGL